MYHKVAKFTKTPGEAGQEVSSNYQFGPEPLQDFFYGTTLPDPLHGWARHSAGQAAEKLERNSGCVWQCRCGGRDGFSTPAPFRVFFESSFPSCEQVPPLVNVEYGATSMFKANEGSPVPG